MKKEKDFDIKEPITTEKKETIKKEPLKYEKKDKVKEPKQFKQAEVKPKIKSKVCKVILTRSNKAIVDFGEFNLNIKNPENKKAGDMIEVKYFGQIGKSDFKIIE